MPRRKKKAVPKWILFEKYCPKCELVHSWSYEKCKKCGGVLATRIKQ